MGYGGQVGQVGLACKGEGISVQIHDGGADIAVARERVDFCIFGEMDVGSVGEGVVDDQVDHAVFSVLTGMAVDVGAFYVGVMAVIDGGAHEGVPEENGKVVGARHRTC